MKPTITSTTLKKVVLIVLTTFCIPATVSGGNIFSRVTAPLLSPLNKSKKPCNASLAALNAFATPEIA